MTTYNVSRKHFTEWLKKFHPDSSVDAALTDPVSHYLRSTRKTKTTVLVEGDKVFTSEGKQYAAPRWTRVFLDEYRHTPFNRFTARRALRILNAIPA